jgi:hypothetical protein
MVLSVDHEGACAHELPSLENKLRTVQKLGYGGYGTSWWELVAFRQEHGDLTR